MWIDRCGIQGMIVFVLRIDIFTDKHLIVLGEKYSAICH